MSATHSTTKTVGKITVFSPLFVSDGVQSSPQASSGVGRWNQGVGAEALLGGAERRVHPGAHVFVRDLVRRLHNAIASETALQVGRLLVGRLRRRCCHGVGVSDGRALVVGIYRRGGVVTDLLRPVQYG